MKRLTMIQEKLLKNGAVSNLAFLGASGGRAGIDVLLRGGSLMRRVVLALMIGLTAIGAWCPGVINAQTSSVEVLIPSEGKEFWVTFLSNTNGASEDETKKEVTLVAASRKAATITVNYTLGGSTTASIPAGGGQVTITLDKSKCYNLVAGTSSRSVFVEATDTISLYAGARDGDYYEACIVLPVDALGYEYIIQNNRQNVSSYRSEFAIIATEDGTDIHVVQRESDETSTPTTPEVISNQTMTLSRGQVYFVKSTKLYTEYDEDGDPLLDDNGDPISHYGNLSGTSIDANKPIAVFQADESSVTPFIPAFQQNYLLEQALPITSWGYEFVVVETQRAQVQAVRITTVYPNTTVFIKRTDGSLHQETIPNAYSTYEYPLMTNSTGNPNVEHLYIFSDLPVMVSAMMPCRGLNSNYGAPAVCVIPPMRQGLKDVTFGIARYGGTKNYVNVVVPTTAVSAMKLDGTSIAGDFEEFEGTGFSYARLNLGTDVAKHRLTNDKETFIATAYGSANKFSYYYPAGFNNVPMAPIVMIDDSLIYYEEGKDYAEIDYCNRHPGINFFADIPYPHTGVKWDFGEEGAIDESPSALHQYKMNIEGRDTTHNVKFYVYLESPLTGVRDTDSVWVKLTVHPAYYDTLKTVMAGRLQTYQWRTSSKPVFGLSGRDSIRLTLGTPDIAIPEKGHISRKPDTLFYKFNSATDATIRDSLIYQTDVYECDSIFYLQLRVVPDEVLPTVYDTVCQFDEYAWLRHAAGTKHKLSRKNLANDAMIFNVDGLGSDAIYATNEAGDFEIRDTIRSLTYPYPGEPEKNIDSIFVLHLHVSHAPTLTITSRKDSICEAGQGEWIFNYEANYADTLFYWLKSENFATTYRIDTTVWVEGKDTVKSMNTLDDGTYQLIVLAKNDTNCYGVADTVPVVINNRPSLEIKPIAPKCYPADEFTVQYTPVDAVKIKYYVDSVGNAAHKITETVIDTVAARSFSINTSGWPAGKYVLFANPISKYGCDSVYTHDTIEILKQPVIRIDTVFSRCDKETTTTLTFTAQYATKYEYKIEDGAWISGTIANLGEHTITLADVNISSLAARAAPYTLTMRDSSAVCGSEEVTKQFVIYEMPSAKITAAAPSTCVTSVDADFVLSYEASAVTTQVKWYLTKPGSGVYGPFKTAAGTSLTIPKAQLQAAGNYQLKIDSVWTSYCDSTGLAYGTLDFEIYDTASVVLNDIEGKCKGTALTATYTFPVLHPTSSYTYTVKTKAGALKGGSAAPITTIDGTIKWTGTDTLSAGKYVLYVQATNDHGCAATEVSKEFEVYPIPQIKTLATPDNVCETEVANREVAFTHSDAQTINYIIKKGSADWITGQSVAASAGKITVRTDTLSSGNYTIEATPVSEHSCTGDKKSVSFEVYEQPTIDLINDDAFCYGKQENLVVAYTHSANVTSFEYFLKKGSAVYKTGTITSLGSSFTIAKVDTLSVGEYILYAIAKSHHADYDCTSKADTVQVTVNVIPTATITNIANACDDKTTTSVTCSVTDAILYNYKIKDQTDWLGEWKLVSSLSEGSFSLGIGSLSAGDYTLQFKVKSAAGCESEVAEKDFTVYPLPEITLPSDTDVCYPALKADIRYTANAAAVGGTYTYSLTGYGISTAIQGTGTLAASGWIEVNTSGLEGGHDYTVSITAVSKDPQNCNTAAAKTGKITIHPRPSLTLNDIADICEQTATVTATISSLTGATKYDYDVLKGEDVMTDEHESGKTGSTITLNTANWAADTYTLRVTAVSDNGCGSVAAEKSFVINHKPTVNVTNRNDSICEGTDNTWTVHYTATHADSIYYRLLASLGTAPKAQGGMRRTSETAFEIAGLKTYTDGTYYLVLQSFNTVTGCESKLDTVNLVINPQPLITLSAPADACAEDETVNVNFTLADADGGSYSYALYNPANTVVFSSDDKTAVASGTISLDIHSLPASEGNYTLKVDAVSRYDCGAVQKQVTFKINTKPQAQIVAVPEQCDDAAKTTVTYQTTDADTCFYYIKSMGDGTKKGVKKSNGADGTFDLDISGLNCTGTTDLIDTLFLISRKGSCYSDTAKKAFIIRVLPTVTLATASADSCYPVSLIQVGYTATNADSLVYTFTKSGESTPSVEGKLKAGASGTIELNTIGLTDGTYTLSVSCLSTYKCNSASAADKTIKILKQPTMESIGDIDNICEHEVATIEVTYSMSDATKYEYILKRGSVEVAYGDNQTAYPLIITSDTLPEGNYTLTMIAKSDDCGSSAKETSFRVYPQPALRIDNAHRKDSICEENDDTWSVTFTASTNVDSLHYWLKPDSAYDATRKESGIRRTTETTLDISGLSTLKFGKYKLIVQGYSEYGCKSVPDTVPLVITIKPALGMGSAVDQCYAESNTTTFRYTPYYADSITYWVEVGETVKMEPKTIKSTGDFSHTETIDVSGWPVGWYVIKGYATSAEGCRGDTHPGASFRIYAKPAVTSVQITDTCVDATNTTVKFTATAATDYRYYIKSKGATTLSAWTPIGTGAFIIPVAGSFVAGTDSLILVVKNGTTGCESDSVRTKFEIFPLPTASITPTSSDLSQCVSYYKTTDMLVAYTSTADSVKWELMRGETAVTSSNGYVPKSAKITIPSANLHVAADNYTLSITGLKTIHSCEVTDAASVSFALNDTACIKLNHIESVCAGNAVTSTYTATNTTSYTYKVDTVGGATKINHTTPVTTIDGVIDLSGTAALQAGKYILRVNATNALDCGGAEASMPFTINPMPAATITSDSASLSRCVLPYYMSTDMHVSYTTTADSVKWVLEKGGYTVVQSTDYELKAAYITIPGTSLAEAGNDYTLTINGLKTIHGCEVTTPQSVNFTLYDTAAVVLNPITGVCVGNAVSATFTGTHINSYTYTVMTKTGAVVKGGSSASIATTDGLTTIDLSKTDTLPHGVYVLSVVPTNSPHNCQGAAMSTEFNIYKQPVIEISNVTEQCETVTTAVTLSYNDTATHFVYWIDTITGANKKDYSATPIAIGANKNVDINGLIGGNYRLRVQASNQKTGCLSEPDTLAFEIYKRSHLQLTDDSSAISTPYPCTSRTIHFADEREVATSANWYVISKATKDAGTWTDGDVLVSGNFSTSVPALPTAAGTFNADFSSLTAGEYYIYGTKTTAHDCADDIDGVFFSIFDQPEIKIHDIDSICEGGTPVNITIESTYASTYTDSIWNSDHELVEHGSGTILSGTPTGAWTTTNLPGIVTSDVNTWKAGTYTVKINVVNGITGGKNDKTTTFVINPIPTLTIAPLGTICQDSTEVTILFSSTHADTVFYRLESADGLTTVIPQDTLVPNTGKVTFDPSATGLNITGKFTFYATPKSEFGCAGAEQSYTFYVNPLPTIVLNSVDAITCEQDSFATVTYTASTNARTYAYLLKNKNGVTVRDSADQVIAAPYDGTQKTFKIDLSNLKADGSPYTLTAVATSDSSCQSVVSNALSFEVKPKPQISELHVTDTCYSATKTRLTFKVSNTDNPTTYSYSIVGKTNWIEASEQPVAAAENDVLIDIDPTAWGAGTYTLRITANSPTCKSDTIDTTFKIKALPSVGLQVNDTCIGDPYVAVKFTDGHSDDADARIIKLTYNLERNGVNLYAEDEVVTVTSGKDTFHVRTDTLTAATYTLHVTPYSSHPCEGVTVSPTFTIHPLPVLGDLTLDPNPVCEGTDTLKVTFTHSGAAKYVYALHKQGSTAVLRADTVALAADGTATAGIALRSPDIIAYEQTYDVDVTLISAATCVTSKTSSFYLHKNPVVSLLPATQEACQPVKEVKFSYVNEGADVLHYEVRNAANVAIVPLADKTGLNTTGDTTAWTISFAQPLDSGLYTIRVTPEDAYCAGLEKTITFRVDTVLPSVIDTAICFGETYDWIVEGCNGQPDTLMVGLSATTSQWDTLFCGEDHCNKVYGLNLTVYQEYAAEDAPHTICANEIWTWRGLSISAPGEYVVRVEDAVDVRGDGTFYCDSVYRITVNQIVPELKTTAQTVCYGEPVVFNGKTYDNLAPGKTILRDTILSEGGCDSVYLQLAVTVGKRYYDSTSVVACDSYLWDVTGLAYTASGIYRDEQASVNGCDSVHVLNLTVSESYEFYETYDILDTELPFTVHEVTYKAAGVYDHNFKSTGGCDSTYHITINTHERVWPKDTLHQPICDSDAPFTWYRDGQDYSQSGWYSQKTSDSIHVLHLTVNKTYHDTAYVKACDSYAWEGTTYTASGTYSKPATSSCGCDSTKVLVLTLSTSTASTENHTVCQHELVSIGNRTYVAMGDSTFTQTLRNAAGCDSVITYNVTIEKRGYADVETDAFCEGTNYVWNVNGHTHNYDKAGTYYDTLFHASGCVDTIYTLTLTAKPQYLEHEDVEVSELALPYTWLGHKDYTGLADTLLRVNGDYYDTLTTVSGCDSVHHIHFHVNFVQRDTTSATGCDSVKWNDRYYTETGLYSDTLFSNTAHTLYDTIHFCDITVKRSYLELETEFTICSNETINWHGQNYINLPAGDTTLTYAVTGANGCDSTHKVQVHVMPSYRIEETAVEVCPSELPYNWKGQLLTATGTYTDEHRSVSDCDSVHVLQFTVKPVTAPTTESVTICEGRAYEWIKGADTLLTIQAHEAGTYPYYHWYLPEGECDSTYHRLDMTVNAHDAVILTDTAICYGESFDWIVTGCNGQPDTLMRGLTESTHQTQSLPCNDDDLTVCDPIYELKLTVYPEYAAVDEPHTICANETWTWRGLSISAPGEYVARVTDAVDVRGDGTLLCDSVYRITVDQIVPQSMSSSKKICYGQSVIFNGKTYSDFVVGNNVLLDTIPTVVDGCDSIYLRMDVTMDAYHYDSVTVSSCDEYTWDLNGQRYTTSGIYREVLSTADNCDDIHVLNLTIYPSYDIYETYDILETKLPFTVHQLTYTAAGEYEHTFKSVGGCDSTYHITINTHELILPRDTMAKVICESEAPFTWYRNGQNYSNSGTYSVTTTDSIHELHLTVNKTYRDTATVKACGGYTWHGTEYTASGTYTKPDVTACGCDSTEVLVLTIGQPTSATANVTACAGEMTTVGTRTFVATANETFTDTLKNVAGCDSVVTYNVTVTLHTEETPVLDTFCLGTSYVWNINGHTYSFEVGGTYRDTIFDADGCATTISTLELTAKPSYKIEEPDVEVAEYALPYTWVGHKDYTGLADSLLTVNGDYYDSLLTQAGCDSIHHIHFHVGFVTRDTVTLEGCDSVLWNGTYYKLSGLYSDTVFTDAPTNKNYDVIHFGKLTVNHRFDEVETAFTTCSNETFVWHGVTYANLPAGDTTLVHAETDVHGCDSTYKVLVHVMPAMTDEASYDACPSELPYNWHGQLLTTAGTYTDSLISPRGCDSVFVLHFTVQAVSQPDTLIDTLCQGETKQWYDLNIAATMPGEYTYYQWYTPDGECDSTYHRLDLTVGETYEVGSDTTVHICLGESYYWYGEERTVPRESVLYVDDHACMKIFDTVKNTVLGCDSLSASLTLIMHMPYEVEDTRTVCDSLVWEGKTQTESGTYVDTLHTIFGCDSIVTMHLTVLHSATKHITIDTCEWYYWPISGERYFQSTHEEVHRPQLGEYCDSVYVLDLTIRERSRDTVTLYRCDSMFWATSGKWYKQDVIDSVVISQGAANGCDRVAYLDLHIQPTKRVNRDTTGCVFFDWKGVTYTDDTVLADTVKYGECNCDSITLWHLSIHQPSANRYDTIERCRVFDEGGRYYTVTTDDTIPGVNMYGCDSLLLRHIIIHHPDTIYDTVTTCNTYTRYAGTDYERTYGFSQDIEIDDFVCDSVIMLHLTLNHDKDTALFVTAWDTYNWHGKTFTESTVVTDTVPTAEGCDSIITLNLILNSSLDTVETQVACETFYWPWKDTTYTETMIDTLTKRIDVGLSTERDSTRILNLTIDTTRYTAFDTAVCYACVWHGVEYKSDTTVWYQVPGICQSYDTMHLRVYHEITVEHYDTACDVMTMFGESFYRDTTITRLLQSTQGCDSTVNYHITISHRTAHTVRVDTCGSYLWEGTTYTSSGKYTKVLTGSMGCDSVVTLVLSIRRSYNHEFNVTSCSSPYIWDGMRCDTTGDWTRTYTSAGGCDSTVTIHLSLPGAIVSGATLDTTVCDNLFWHGKLYSAAGEYADTLTSAVTGCDSVVWLYLHIADKPTGEFSDSARAAYTWRGETYYVSGDYVQALPTAGCDSLVTLHLTILNPVSVTEIADTACDMYTWDAETFYQSGTYTRNFPTVDGRDSIVTLSLVINHDTTVYITDQLCDSVVWNGETYYETGTYTQVLQRASGCDSVVTLTLTVCQRFATSFTVTARDVYTWEDADYTESGEYSRTYQSVLGCDSTSTMHLTIISNTHTELSDTACSSYAWADSIFTSSTIHTKVYPAANGCDSVVTLSLIVHQPLYTDLYDTACTETYLFAGETLTHTGIYYDTLNSAITGCDSIVVLHLQWCADTLCADTTWLTVDSVCEQYVWEGETYNTTGTYTRHHRLENGCDSVVIMRLEMQQKYQQFIDTVACDSLLWKGDTITVSGFYRDTLTAQNGCDSIVVLHAMIGHSGDSTMYRESCDGLTINGITYTESGTYIQNLTTTTGCDSTLTIELVINSSADTIVKEEACDTLLWNGQTLTTSGIYPMVLQTDSTGCDSVVNLHLIVYDHKESYVVDTTSCDSIIWGDEVVGYDTLYIDSIYTKTFVSAVGCDSIVTMNLKLLRHDFIVASDTAACDSFVWRDKVIYDSGTYFDTLPNTLTGCDSITQMTITINPTLRRDTIDTVPPPFHVWELNGDTLWKSGVYTDTVPSLVTGCDSIVTLHLILTDSIILDPQEPLSVDTFGYCQGDTAHITFNLLKGHPNRYMLTFNYGAWNIPEGQRIPSVDTTALPGGNDYGTFDLYIPENCKPGAHYATLQMFDDRFHSEEYDVVIYVSLGRKIVTLWNDVVAINNVENEFIGYQWFVDDVLVQGATKQYYSNGEELHAWYRARVQLADDSTWVYTCNQYIDMTTDSLRLIVYPTPAPTGVPVTIKAQGILLENLQGAQLYVHDALGNVVHSNLNMTQRTEVVTLPAGMYIVTLTTDKTNDAEKGPRTETAKFTVF